MGLICPTNLPRTCGSKPAFTGPLGGMQCTANGIWLEHAWTQSKSCLKLQKLGADSDMPFLPCPRNLGGLPSTRSGWSEGPFLALSDAVADVIPMGSSNRPLVYTKRMCTGACMCIMLEPYIMSIHECSKGPAPLNHIFPLL